MRFFATQLLFFFILFSGNVNSQNPDIDLLRGINKNRNEKLDPFFTLLSKTVIPISVASPPSALIIGLIRSDTTFSLYGATAIVAVGLTGFSVYSLKAIIKRPRPYQMYPDLQNTETASNPYSFPSGSTALAFGSATSLYLVYPHWYVAIPAFTWAGLVGYARMHQGIHYPTDVLAGAIVGIGSAWLSHRANQWVKKRYRL